MPYVESCSHREVVVVVDSKYINQPLPSGAGQYIIENATDCKRCEKGKTSRTLEILQSA